jgi:hypothetical protein
MASILALYRGQTVAEAKLVAVTAEPDIISRFARELIGEAAELEQDAEFSDGGPLRLVRGDEE